MLRLEYGSAADTRLVRLGLCPLKCQRQNPTKRETDATSYPSFLRKPGPLLRSRLEGLSATDLYRSLASN